MNDETTMAEALGASRAENEDLKKQLAASELKFKNASFSYHTANAARMAVEFLCLGVVLCAFAYPIMKSFSTPHVVDHCYLKMDRICGGERDSTCEDVLVLKGNVEWSNDDSIGTFKTIEEAAVAAERLKCPMLKGAP